MKRIEIIQKMEELEERKNNFENVLNDLDSYYYNKAGIVVIIDSKDFNKKYIGEHIEIDKIIFKGYLKEEIKKIENKIIELITGLK